MSAVMSVIVVLASLAVIATLIGRVFHRRPAWRRACGRFMCSRSTWSGVWTGLRFLPKAIAAMVVIACGLWLTWMLWLLGCGASQFVAGINKGSACNASTMEKSRRTDPKELLRHIWHEEVLPNKSGHVVAEIKLTTPVEVEFNPARDSAKVTPLVLALVAPSEMNIEMEGLPERADSNYFNLSYSFRQSRWLDIQQTDLARTENRRDLLTLKWVKKERPNRDFRLFIEHRNPPIALAFQYPHVQSDVPVLVGQVLTNLPNTARLDSEVCIFVTHPDGRPLPEDHISMAIAPPFNETVLGTYWRGRTHDIEKSPALSFCCHSLAGPVKAYVVIRPNQ